MLLKNNNPYAGLDRPWEGVEFEAPRFQGNWHMKEVSLSALLTCRLYLMEIFVVLISIIS